MTTTRLLAAVLAAAPLLVLSAPASAAASYDACVNTIATLPTTITTQGTWCLNKDLNTPLASGAAITIAANNVTLDCNGYKLGGLLAGDATQTTGVYSNGRSNVTVRDCNIRGFYAGISLEGESGGGHRIERNRFENNTGVGLAVIGDGSLVRDNLVIDTGGSTNGVPIDWVMGIGVAYDVDVIDNQVVGVFGTVETADTVAGIFVSDPRGSVIARNRISAIVVADGVEFGPIGIAALGSGPLDIRDNTIANDEIDGNSVGCMSELQVLHANALMMGPPIGGCGDGGGNYGYAVPD